MLFLFLTIMVSLYRYILVLFSLFNPLLIVDFILILDLPNCVYVSGSLWLLFSACIQILKNPTLNWKLVENAFIVHIYLSKIKSKQHNAWWNLSYLPLGDWLTRSLGSCGWLNLTLPLFNRHISYHHIIS